MRYKPTTKDWILATRPWSFPASSLPALVAFLFTLNMYQEQPLKWVYGVIAIFGAVVFHAGGNLLSDYHDYKSGVDREDTVGVETLTSKLFTPKQIFTYGLCFVLVGIAIGLYLVANSGITLLWIGLIGFIGTVFYYQFKYRALGDLLIFVVYGPTIMLGTSYAMLGHIDWSLLYLSLPIAFITVNILHSNNARDIRSDKSANIKTQAMLLGIKGSIIQYYVLIALSYASIVAMILCTILPVTALITFLTLPIALKNCKAMSKITESDTTPINELDKGTAQLQLVFSGLLSIALIINLC